MELWVSRSRPGLQLGIGIGAAVVGSVLVWGMHDFAARGDDALAGFALGVLLLVIGAASVFVTGAQTVTVDPRKRLIEVTDVRPVGKKLTAISFQQVVRVSVGYVGKRSNFANTYYLILHLTDGREYPLFAPGRFYEGSSDRSVVEGWRERLQAYLAQSSVRA